MQNYNLLKLQDKNEEIVNSFNYLPDDAYLNKTEAIYRKRRYSTAQIQNGELIWNNNSSTFMQSSQINAYLGDVNRLYEQIVPKVLSYLEKNVISFRLDPWT